MNAQRSLFVIAVFFIFHSVFVICPSAQASVPKPTGRFVNDFANILDDAAEQRLEQSVREIQNDTSAEVAVVTVSTLNRMSVEEYAVRLFKEWGIGRAKEDNGVLVLVSTEDRDLRIEVGYGLEGVIPDGLAGEINRTSITPRFKEGDFAGGLTAGVNRIGTLLRANHVMTPDERAKLDRAANDQGPIWILIPFLSIFVAIGAFMLGIGFKSKTVFALLFGLMFGGIPSVMGLAVAPIWSLVVFTPIAIALGVLGYRRGDGSGSGSSGSSGGWTMSSGSGSGGSWSSGSSSSSSFGGGSSGGGGSSSKW